MGFRSVKKVPRRKYVRLGRSFELLKAQWWRLDEEDRWRLLRSIITREHLHVVGHFAKHYKSDRVPNSASLLRRRRLDIAGFYRERGALLGSELFMFSLPKNRAWPGLNGICPATPPAIALA